MEIEEKVEKGVDGHPKANQVHEEIEAIKGVDEESTTVTTILPSKNSSENPQIMYTTAKEKENVNQDRIERKEVDDNEEAEDSIDHDNEQEEEEDVEEVVVEIEEGENENE